ncbi:MAG: YgdI/YgdR family lipoprotein [Actinomycetota bacterium]|nr:YgdI/YgdR family lipoprotein [Actinomycetota bacterium]
MRRGDSAPWAKGRARMALGVGACLAATAIAGCSTVDPYEITCRELITSPDKLRETSF